MTSGLLIKSAAPDAVEIESNYLVLQTLQDGETRVYQAGKYIDRLADSSGGGHVEIVEGEARGSIIRDFVQKSSGRFGGNLQDLRILEWVGMDKYIPVGVGKCHAKESPGQFG